MTAGVAATETETCVACGGPLSETPHTFAAPREADGAVLRCARCGGAQVVPRPTAADVVAVYSREYFESYMAGPGVKGGTETVSDALKARLIEAERRLGGRGRMVDVGCAYGLFVGHARDRGWDAAGIEPSHWAAEEGRRRFGITIHEGDVESAPIPPGTLDFVHANHVLEHLVEPAATITAAARLLRPGGLVAIEVPQELRKPLTDRVYGRLHPELYPAQPPDPTHLEFFSSQGLTSLLCRAGLEIVSVRTVRHEPNLSTRLPFGRSAKRMLVRIEESIGTAPDLVAWARRPAA